MSRLLHISASPAGAESESLAIAATFADAYRETHGDVVDHFDLWDGTLPAFGPAAAGAKMTVFAGGEPAGPAGRRVAGRPADLRPLRLLRPLPVQRPDVELRRPVHPQAVHRRRVPARLGLLLRPRTRVHGSPARQEGRRRLHQRRVRGRPPARRSAPTTRPRSWTAGCAGPGSPTSAPSSSARTSPPPTPRPDAARRTPRRGNWASASDDRLWRRNGREGNT